MNLWLVKDLLYLIILTWEAYQDWKKKSITKNSLLIAGVLGVTISVLLGRQVIQIIISCSLGIALLALNKCTNDGIGEGDGWFFFISGFYMDWHNNLQMFLTGLFLCFGASLILVVQGCFRKRKNKITLPFLPFVLPAGIEMILNSVRSLQ